MSLPDLRIAIRHLLRAPGFSATAVLMLAVGIGATTAVFSIVEAVLLRPLPFPESERLVTLGDIIKGAESVSSGSVSVTSAEIPTYVRETHSFESLGGYQPSNYELSGIGEPAQPIMSATAKTQHNATRVRGICQTYEALSELLLRVALSLAAGLPLHRRKFGLPAPRVDRPKYRPATDVGAPCRMRGVRAAADRGGHRRQRQLCFDCAAPAPWLCDGRHHSVGGLQIRAMGRHGADAAIAR